MPILGHFGESEMLAKIQQILLTFMFRKNLFDCFKLHNDLTKTTEVRAISWTQLMAFVKFE